MGLFINKNEHPDVYKNIENIHAPNQRFIRHNYLTELINEQQETNMTLANSIAELKPRYEQLEEMQTIQWNHVKDQISDLIVSNRQREKMENIMIQRLDTIDENENLLKNSIIDQMNSLNESYQKMLSRLETNESAYEQLSLLLNKQLELQKEVADTLLKQEEFQTGVLNRLDTQEALTEKISRQLSNIRSILFERTNYIASKLEDGYKKTSAYVYKLMTTSSDQPPSSASKNHKMKIDQKQTD